MKFRWKKRSNQLSDGESRNRPVLREHAETVQRCAEAVTNASEKHGKNITGETFARRQQKKIEQYMARLRQEAVKARQLAQHIDKLSLEVATLKRKRVMTDSSTINPGKVKNAGRRASDKPHTPERLSSFNPLHPSMELPPEQLIRLLGLETKKIRKQRKSAASAAPAPKEKTSRPAVQETPNPGPETEPAQTQRAPHATYPARKTRRAHVDTSVFGEEKRGRLLLPALATGLIAGIAFSVYLFWGQPAPGNEQEKAAPAVVQKPGATKPARVAEKLPNAGAKPVVRNDPAWRATVNAQGARLRAEADQRFRQRLTQTESSTKPLPAISPPSTAVNEQKVVDDQIEAVAAPRAVETANEPVTEALPAPDTLDPVSGDKMLAEPYTHTVPGTATIDDEVNTPQDAYTEPVAAAPGVEVVAVDQAMETVTRSEVDPPEAAMIVEPADTQAPDDAETPAPATTPADPQDNPALF